MEPEEEFTTGELNLIIDSLDYSKLKVRESEITPYDMKKEKLDQLDALTNKIRNMRKYR